MRKPGLIDFTELVKNETLLLNDPLFSKPAIDQYCEKPSKGSQQNPKHKRNKLTTYVTMADSCKTAGLELSLNERIKILRKKSLNERIKILRKGKLCYGCLKPMAKDHNAKNCQQ